MDIDSLYLIDYYGTGDRFVCMVYVDYNAPHYLNINKALVVEGLAKAIEFKNDFSPDNWTLYIRKHDIRVFSNNNSTIYLLTHANGNNL